MKRVLLAVLAAFIVAHAPWRLAVLYVEVWFTAPGYVRTSASNDLYWSAKDLEQRLSDHGWAVTYDQGLLDQGMYGFTDPSDHSIHVDASLSWNARFATLAHEGGHTLQPYRRTAGQREAFAESVAMLVSHDGFREHARYLASIRPDFLIEALVDWQAIYRAAAMLQS